MNIFETSTAGAGTLGAVSLRTVTVPVVPKQPIDSPPVPRHPFMAPNGRSNTHNDAYMSDSYDLAWPAPLGGELEVRLGLLDGLCITLAFDNQGRIVTVRAQQDDLGAIRHDLLLLDPRTMETLASYPLPSGGGGSSGGGSGAYFYLDHKDRPVVSTAEQSLMVFDLVEYGFEKVWKPALTYELASAINDPSAAIESALPDWKGNIWFVTDTGTVGLVNTTTGDVRAMRLPEPEQIGNSFAVDATGGVFIVSDHAQYRFDMGPDGGPQVTWRYTYDRGTEMKPGEVNFGSGTTPTLIGDGWLGITDNAGPQMHVLVYRRERDYTGNRKMAEIPVFAEGASDTENSLMAAGETFIVENNYGYTGTYKVPTGPVTPGMARVSWPAPGFGATMWSTEKVVVPSVVSKVSLATGLVYTYTMEQMPGGQEWFVAAVSASTGELAWKVPIGPGQAFDNHYSALFLGPDGTIYVPVYKGIVSVGRPAAI